MKIASHLLVCLALFTPLSSANRILRRRDGDRSGRDRDRGGTPCTNSAAGAAHDAGCPIHKPICADAESEEPPFEYPGVKCGVCVNNNDDDAMMDLGCSAEASVCKAPFGKVGTSCREARSDNATLCVNTSPLLGQDEGCPFDKPICMTSNRTEPDLGGEGDSCGMCINDMANDTLMDLGCTEEEMVCKASFGEVGKSCCSGEKRDRDRSSSRSSMTCNNTISGGELDEGCTVDHPICVNATSMEEIDLNAEGGKCVTCIKLFVASHYPTHQDAGCTVEFPRCMKKRGEDPDLLKGGSKCCAADGNCT